MTVATTTATAVVPPLDAYTALLAELGDFTKSMTAEDAEGDPEKVEQAAAEAGATVPGDSEKPESTEKKEGEEKPEDDADMVKAISVTMPDGSVQEMIDAGDMLKSMKADVDTLKGSLTDLTAQLAAVTAERDSALKLSRGVLAGMKQQGEMLKSLSATVAKIGNAPVGRKATLVVTEAAAVIPTTGTETTINTEEFFAKAMTLVGTDGWCGRDISECEARIARGLPPQPELAAAVAKIA